MSLVIRDRDRHAKIGRMVAKKSSAGGGRGKKKADAWPVPVADEAEVKARFEQRHGSDYWAAVFDREPWLQQACLDAIRAELQIEEIAARIQAERKAMRDYMLATSDAGSDCIHPLLQIQKNLRASWLAKIKTLRDVLQGGKLDEENADDPYAFMDRRETPAKSS